MREMNVRRGVYLSVFVVKKGKILSEALEIIGKIHCTRNLSLSVACINQSPH